MKRNPSLFARLLVPVLLFLTLLPPAACLIFRQAALSYAYSEAESDLQALQQSILPLMTRHFSSDELSTQDKIRNFLRNVSAVIRKYDGSAKLLIYSSDMRMVYPSDEQERADAETFSALCADYILSSDFQANTSAQRLTGETDVYLVSVYQVPTRSQQVEYLVAYRPVSQIGTWVSGAAKMVLSIFYVAMLLIALVLWLTARSVARPLSSLCRYAGRIGSGDFCEIETPFPLREPEMLRLSMNEMSRQLCRSEESQRTFFQNVSHELRNPLMSICGYAQGIERGVFPDPKQAAHTILEESQRLTALVSSLLTLSRIESGQHAPTLLPLCVNDCIADSLDRAAGSALQKQVDIRFPPADGRLLALGDEDLLSHVLNNLLSNAIRYAHSSVSVAVRSENGHILITVCDDGEGIAPQDLPHIFERCYKGRGGHFGIGLAIAHSAAEQMRGSLTAQNRPEGGACFTLTLLQSQDK